MFGIFAKWIEKKLSISGAYVLSITTKHFLFKFSQLWVAIYAIYAKASYVIREKTQNWSQIKFWPNNVSRLHESLFISK